MRALMCLGMLAMLAGCDTSRVELESAKTNLMNTTKERDDLKAQVATLQQQLNTARSDLAKEKTAEAQAPAGKTDKTGSADSKGVMASKTSSPSNATASKKKGAHKS